MSTSKFDPQKVYRYDADSGRLNIDIDLDYYRELYSEWDFSPQHNRDLDGNLFKYLVDCSDEIPDRYPVAIAINLPANVYDKTREERATEGFHNFFTYQLRRKNNRYRHYYSKIITYLCIGALLLVAASMLKNLFSGLAHSDLLVEGLVIGAWVSLWEVFSVIFFNLSEHRKEIRSFRRLLNAEIVYRYRPVSGSTSSNPDVADL